MPSWGEILQELNETAAASGSGPDFDSVRRKYLRQLQELTGRNTILYYSGWMGGGGGSQAVAITLEDMQGMMEVVRGMEGGAVDIVLHSPGGSPEATDSIVRYLRQKFDDVRVFVPLAAMSAATMWALSANRIVMGKHSQLGPIDPQLVMAQGTIPAGAIIRQFDQAVKECQADPSRLAAWLPILQQYGPALLQQCEAAAALATRLVAQWLESYMLPNNPDIAAGERKAKAKEIADWFAADDEHRSHSIGIGRDEARSHGVVIDDLEDDAGQLQDAVLSVHHATMHHPRGAVPQDRREPSRTGLREDGRRPCRRDDRAAGAAARAGRPTAHLRAPVHLTPRQPEGMRAMDARWTHGESGRCCKPHHLDQHVSGAGCRDRTDDIFFTREVLYQLS